MTAATPPRPAARRTTGNRAIPPEGRIRVPRVAALPRVGRLRTPLVHIGRPAGSIPVARAVTRRPARSIGVARPFRAPPVPGAKSVVAGRGEVGPTERGRVAQSDRVVVKIASRAAAEISDAGAVGAKILGASVPGLDRIGGRVTGLESLPKTTAEVDGTQAFVAVEISVRYPASLPATTAAVRDTVADRVHAYTGLDVREVDIVVGALVTDLPTPPRVH